MESLRSCWLALAVSKEPDLDIEGVVRCCEVPLTAYGRLMHGMEWAWRTLLLWGF
jgi:hypothetical protein